MEKLNSDEKISFLMRLEGREIIQVCQTSREMFRICNDERYDNLWHIKILEEFGLNYRGKRGFDKYRELSILHSAKIYIVTITDTENAEDSFSMVYYNLQDAEDYIILAFENGAPDHRKTSNTSRILTGLHTVGYVQKGHYMWRIEETQLQKKTQRKKAVALKEQVKTEREEYLQKKENFYRHLEEVSRRESGESEIDRVKINDFLVDIFTDLNSSLENGSSDARIIRELDRSLKMFATEGVPKSELGFVKQYILDNLIRKVDPNNDYIDANIDYENDEDENENEDEDE